jgi:ADP-heptose:LPS heptosyltransferase
MKKAEPQTKPSRPKLLVLELWGLGDLAMATPFIQAASEKYEVTVVAKDYGRDLQPRFWPSVNLITNSLPWTAFRKKYHLWRWPWKNLFRLVRQLRREKFDFAVSARWDPRDHVLMWLVGARQRFGFPRTGSQFFLTKTRSAIPAKHRYEHWRELGVLLGLTLPATSGLRVQPGSANRRIIIHTGASLPLRVWPLERFKKLAAHLRKQNSEVLIACDTSQRDWWANNGEPNVFSARNVSELTQLLDSAKAFIGNDSGPGHLAAICGTPTFTIFGPALPELIAPIHPLSAWADGKPCKFKPCKDYCRFSVPHCLQDISEAEVQSQVNAFLRQLENNERSSSLL